MTATKRAMATAMRVAGNEEGNGKGGKRDGNGIEGVRQLTATRLMATRVVAEQWQQGQWHWQWQQQWQ